MPREVDVKSPGGELGVYEEDFERLLKLAEFYGWRPTRDDWGRHVLACVLEASEEADFEARSRNAAASSEYRPIPPADALGLAEALESALEDIPNHEAAKPEKHEPERLGFLLRFFSGDYKDMVREMVKLCRAGSVTVHRCEL